MCVSCVGMDCVSSCVVCVKFGCVFGMFTMCLV